MGLSRTVSEIDGDFSRNCKKISQSSSIYTYTIGFKQSTFDIHRAFVEASNKYISPYKKATNFTLFVSIISHIICNKLCGKPRNMPPPLYAARCSPSPAHTRLTPAASSAPCAMNIHDRQAAARSGRWRRNWCRPYKLCSDLNSQPKRPDDIDILPFDLESGVQVTCDVSYLCANFGLPRPHFSRLRPDIRDRQTVRQTSD